VLTGDRSHGAPHGRRLKDPMTGEDPELDYASIPKIFNSLSLNSTALQMDMVEIEAIQKCEATTVVRGGGDPFEARKLRASGATESAGDLF
jgi:hypothetical protein